MNLENHVYNYPGSEYGGYRVKRDICPPRIVRNELLGKKFILAKHTLQNANANTFDAAANFAKLYMNDRFELSYPKSLIEKLLKKRVNEIYNEL